MHRSILLILAIGCFAGAAVSAPPELPDGTDAATRRMAVFKFPKEMKVELFAAEPKLASPVAIGLDERNRVYVAEEYRFNLGTEENRTRPFLLDDDLQIQTLDDRLKMYQKFAARFDGGMDWFRKVGDQVRLVEDSDGDGKADRSTVFAPDFNGTLDGLAAGVMATDGDVYFTCIPNLWRLRDTNGDGIADERTILQTGFGVNAGFLGHDLHGLCWGPDGKLYFSIGDRGFHLATSDGRTLHGPRNGAIFRCFPDGSAMEVVCRGLRNPQEIAFDQFGNLFAADNNCDKGDHSRLVFCLEGSDSGWNMAYQSIPDPYLTGPWHAERMWHLWNGDVSAAAGQPAADSTAASPDRPAWVLPPVGKLGAGPSGFTYYPGTGLPTRYDRHFFLCNYTGNGGIEAFGLRPRGAGFEIIDEHDFLKPVFATDCEFGYDGKLYVSDFVNLIWNGGSSGGRIYTLFDPRHVNSPVVRQTADLVRKGLKNLDSNTLDSLLAHADQRVRQRAQFELAARGAESIPRFTATLAMSTHRLARLHALWGLGQLAGPRTARSENSADIRSQSLQVLRSHIHDHDDEVRAWTARLLGDHLPHGASNQQPSGSELVVGLLSDPSPRVRLFAALAISKLPFDHVPGELLTLIRNNNDADPWIRHGCVMALASLAAPTDLSRIQPLFQDKSPAVRLAALLAVRHAFKRQYEWSFTPLPAPGSTAGLDVLLQNSLLDEQMTIVTEAARAIHDLPLEASAPRLAAMTPLLKGSSAATVPAALARRIISVNFRLGEPEHARRVLSLVLESSLSLTLRKEALAALIDWAPPGPRDRVTGFWRPLPARDRGQVEQVKSLLGDNVAALLGAGPDLQTEVVKLISRFHLPTDDTVFIGWIRDSTRNEATRTAALRLLSLRNSPQAPAAIEYALACDRPLLRAEARDLLARLKPAVATELLESTLNSQAAATVERQRALATLSAMSQEAADTILRTWIARLNAGQVPAPLQLDVLEAATMRDLPELKQAADTYRAALAAGDLSARHRISLEGGDPDRGREIFVGHRVGQCVRCHKIGTALVGGTAGPDLHQVATRHDRASLLQSLVDPNARIAKGFETVTLVMQNGQVFGGLIRKEEGGEILLEKPEGGLVTLKASDVEERTPPKSAMPEMNRALSPRELRDVVEFLSQLR